MSFLFQDPIKLVAPAIAILDEFGLRVTIINGDTNSTSERGPSRLKFIAAFKEAPGLGVIILSTTAVGFGANVQAGNHVIHFTRPWDPAKEDRPPIAPGVSVRSALCTCITRPSSPTA
jgi:hypothetical protein